MSDKEVDDSLIKCEKEADASVKCLDGCKAKHSGEKEVDKFQMLRRGRNNFTRPSEGPGKKVTTATATGTS
ncbi:hypothetical protein Q1695_009884 [Nippostrongylus brasiliensis]|nr:hypothetical protein Q1695_009884 [Nippostrongylus brasiliensis]